MGNCLDTDAGKLTGASEKVLQKTTTQLQIKENPKTKDKMGSFVNVGKAQICMDQNHEKQLGEVHKAMTKLQRDLDTLSPQTRFMKTQHEEHLQEREEIIDRYRTQLSTSLEREKLLEQKVMQLELEWQKNCEDIRNKYYLEHESLIQELSLSREKAKAELEEMKEELQEQRLLLQCVTKERDQALQRITPETGVLASEELAALQQQNRRLHAVVSEMRKQMEELSSIPQPSHSANSDNKVNRRKTEDVQHLEPNIPSVTEKVQTSSSVCSCGHVNTAVSQLYSRLKQAASCIARLNRDRQQLIELCNRLRAQMCSDEQRCPRKDVIQRTEEGSKKRLNQSLEQEPSRTQNLPQGHSEVIPDPRLYEESLPSLSAVWALLDQGPPQDPTADSITDPTVDASEQVTGARCPMEVYGVSAPVHSQPTVRALLQRGHTKHRPAVAKIRNYNIKD